MERRLHVLSGEFRGVYDLRGPQVLGLIEDIALFHVWLRVEAHLILEDILLTFLLFLLNKEGFSALSLEDNLLVRARSLEVLLLSTHVASFDLLRFSMYSLI